MKRFLVALAFLVAACTCAQAGTYTSYQGSAYRNINGTTYWKGDATSFAASKATVIESVKVGGTHIGVPFIGEFGAAALTAGIAAMRSTPGAMATTAVISYLAKQGIEYLDGQWKSKGPSIPQQNPTGYTPGYKWCSPSNVYCDSTPQKTCEGYAARSAAPWQGAFIRCDQTSATTTQATFNAVFQNATMTGWPIVRNNDACGTDARWNGTTCVSNAPCATGYHLVADLCVPDAYVPAGQSDWDRVLGVTPPDEVMKDICARLFALDGKGCPVKASTAAAEAPLSDWATDPNNPNVQSRQKGKWTPAPTADDPFRGEVSAEKETKTTGIDPTTGQPTTTTKKEDSTKDQDFCTLHPESIVCAKMDVPEEPDITNKDKQVTITPDGGWGPDSGSCPADKVENLRSGGQIVISYAGPCQVATSFRPVVIGFAWLTAVLIAVGMVRRFG